MSSWLLRFMPDSFSPDSTLPRMVMLGNGLGFWKTMPIFSRMCTGSTSGA